MSKFNNYHKIASILEFGIRNFNKKLRLAGI